MTRSSVPVIRSSIRLCLAVIVAGIVAGTVWLGAVAGARADSLIVTPLKDNTLIESADGANSNGAGDGIFSGRLAGLGGGLKLRAVLAFDLTSIPSGSTVNSASLTLTIAMRVGGNQTHRLYRLLADWGEGTSSDFGGLGSPATRSDATWIHTFHPDGLWALAGGDFAAAQSAAAIVGNFGTATWSGPGLAADVQTWVDDPTTNFGWILRGNESVLMTAKKFVSRQGTEADWPKLTIDYTPPPPCPADIAPVRGGDGTVNVDDLLLVINSWGDCPPSPPGRGQGEGCPADIAPVETGGDDSVNVDDLLAVINAWGEC